MTTPASAEPTEVEAMRAWIADHAPVWNEQVGEQTEAAVVSLSDAAFVAAQFTARALASQRAEIVARYEEVADELTKNAGRYDDGDPRCDVRLSAAARIREAAPK